MILFDVSPLTAILAFISGFSVYYYQSSSAFISLHLTFNSRILVTKFRSYI
ncbi:unnamed protein product [Brugia timori]|uniref:Uncharacterized protein n=1 Tax=Brugia timori TaxID=42155 RepID=A0A0R3R9Y3_9BILA|nr:unnamed protein product [Brugia timori]